MRRVCGIVLIFSLTVGAAASAAQAQQPPPATPAADQKKPDPPDPQKPEQDPKFEETVVVSASRTEERLVNAPATMSVISAATIENLPSRNFAELLRSIPGLNVTQVSARDINVTSRGATGTLATGTLALLDGRSLYQDFFGFVMWDFLPVNLDEIKRIEVIRGPASAVWGANAVNGVVNVITKTPREMQGTTVTFGLGAIERSVDNSTLDDGSLYYFSGSHAQAINDRWSFKFSAGGYTQDALPRPTGVIPGSPGTPYPEYRNTGTTQPKVDGRLDYEMDGGALLSFSGGVAGTDGIMHTGIGPFDVNSGTTMGYAKGMFSRGGLRANVFVNVLDGNASNLLTRDVALQPIAFDFETRTYDVELSNVHAFSPRQAVTYGGNLRYNHFDLSLAPEGDNRVEFGIYGQSETSLSDHFRLVAGARVDRFDYLDDFVFSPRVALMMKPRTDQTFRVSYNRAYRSPSVINNFLDVTVVEPVNLGLFSPALAGRVYPLPVRSVGNPDLKEQSLDAFEVGYTGSLANRAVVSAAFYVNRTKNDIFFTELTEERFTALRPPPGWPLPASVIALIPGASFPAKFTYLNFGRVTQRGLEVGIEGALSRYLSAYVNYSWQAEPEPDGFDLSELNIPSENRVNAGLALNYRRFVGNVSISYAGDAFWQDVLDARYHGTTEAYTLVNGGAGVRWLDDQITTTIKLINLGNQEVQQHVFGDILKRQVIGEVKVRF